MCAQADSHIFWNDKKGKCGGYLDVDMNASKKNLVDAPIENLFWDDPPPGNVALEFMPVSAGVAPFAC